MNEFNRFPFSLMMMALMLFFFLCTAGISAQERNSQPNTDKPFGLVIHGGAGIMEKVKMPEEKEKQYRQKLEEALTTGYRILEQGGKALDAVEAAIRILEDSPLFNAGKGAVFAANGMNELDASIMDGKSLNAGAVAEVTHIKNPISLARLVMEKSSHVLLAGAGAETFAKQMGIKLVSNKYFFTKERWEGLLKAQKEEKEKAAESKGNKCGTVGAVALDKNGDLAAGTSTGGMTNKRYGRVGDSPIIGAGTYANNRTCAVSGTGYGEYFIRSVVAYDISALMEYTGSSVQQAAETAIDKMSKMGGYGGVIAIDHAGNVAMPFSTSGMYRGYLKSDGKMYIGIFKDEAEPEKK
ncbi:MAG: isoaspartyl peptidase/L-asparaginase family protein [Candidatus Omnitrophota bacterium]